MNSHCLGSLKLALLSIGLIVSGIGTALAQHAYPTPEAAADAFVDAVKRNDDAAMRTVLGADWRKLIPKRDVDREDVDTFLAAWDKAHHIENAGPDKAALAAGEQNWTLPIPIMKTAGGWHFDPRAGADEMKTRRIGRNELSTMQAAMAYFDAQKEYARVDRTGDGVLHYAQKFASTPGKHDGLYWPVKEDEKESPLGPLFSSRGDKKTGEGYHGYRYKILQAQGKDAPGGAYSYLIKGRMVSGFALIAWPLRYGDTGIMSFMISHDGQLYEKDLGEQSGEIAQAMTQFNPDASWHKVDIPNSR